MSLSLGSKVKLLDGNEIPVLGFGTYELASGDEAYNAVKWALEAGYRHIDSAAWYENEAECGRAIRDFCAAGTPRSEVFFTTKLRDNNGYQATKKAIQASLKACDIGYIDLYLMHSPLGGPEIRKECWRAVCDAQKEGNLKSIGVSNFGVKHIQEMVDGKVELPTINQIDLHPFMTRTDVVDICRKHKIELEAWAPLVRGFEEHNHPSIEKLAKKYNKECAQVLLRYSLQKGFIPLPKSTNKSRIYSNTNIFDFELTNDEVAHLDTLDKSLLTDWDVTGCP